MTPTKDKITLPYYAGGGLRLSRRYERNRKAPRYCRLCGTRLAYDNALSHCSLHSTPKKRMAYKRKMGLA